MQFAHQLLSVLGISAAAGVSAAYFKAKLPVWKRISEYAARLADCKELAPPPSDEAHARMMKVAHFLARRFIGPITIEGGEDLAALPGPFVLVSNHAHPLDLVILNILLNRKARHPGAKGVLGLGGGLLAWWGAKYGMFSVDPEKGAAAYKTMVTVLEQGEIVYLFPEGWTHMTGMVHNFKTGASRAALEASQKLGKTVAIVAVNIRYGWYPDESILKYHVAIQWLLSGFRFRNGARVVVSKPVNPLAQPDDPHAAASALKAIVVGLNPSTKTA